MRVYEVGGAVRDELMGFAVQDRDYVVVGSSHDEMIGHGFTCVGKDFPVYLSSTGEEYALARRERKNGLGYVGFEFDSTDVSLEEDLSRRDFTVNALARDGNEIIDPFGGVEDISTRTLRHVSEAFVEDPVRVLRLARFRARWGSEWKVAPETRLLIRKMSKNGVLNELQRDRIWKETSRALMETTPRLFFDTLLECDVLHVLFPSVYRLKTALESILWHPEGDAYEHTMLVLQQAASRSYSLKTRLCAVTHDLGKGLTPRDKLPAHHGHEISGVKLTSEFLEQIGAPTRIIKHARHVTRHHMNVHRVEKMRSVKIVDMFTDMDAWRDPEVVESLAELATCDTTGRLGHESASLDHVDLLRSYFRAANSVKFIDVFPSGQPLSADAIPEKMRLARATTVDEWRKNAAHHA